MSVAEPRKGVLEKREPPQPEFTLRGHGASVHCVRFVTPKMVLSGDQSGTAKVWDVDVQRPVASWQATHHVGDSILEVHCVAGGVLTQGRDGFMKLWDLDRIGSDDARIRSFTTNAFHFTRCAVATPVELRDDAPQPPPQVSSSSSSARAAAPTTGIGAALLSEDDDDDFQPEEFAVTEDDEATSLVPSQLILAPCEESSMNLWDARSETPAMKLDHGPDAEKGLGMVMSARLWIPPTGMPVALIGHESGDLLVWDLRRHGRIHAQKKIMQAPILGLQVAPNGKRLYAAAIEPKAKVFDIDIAAGTCRQRGPDLTVTCEAIEHDKEGVGDLALRPDGRIFATAGWDYRIRVFSARTLQPLAVLRYHDASVNALDFSPDSTLLAAAAKDSKISLWRLFPPKKPPEN